MAFNQAETIAMIPFPLQQSPMGKTAKRQRFFTRHLLIKPISIHLALFILLVAGYFAANMAIAAPQAKSYERWRTDFHKSAIPIDAVVDGGPGRDGIPPIDKTRFVDPSAVTGDYFGTEPVVAVNIGNDARAYPLSILVWHEVINDKIGGVPVVISYSPLCNSAMVFDARINGLALKFGNTGRLYKSNLLMYDRTSESWWQQFTGDAVVGSQTGKKLAIIPSSLMSFDAFRKQYAGGKIMVPNDPDFREYGRNPYPFYDTGERPVFYSGGASQGIGAMERVVLVRHGVEKPVAVRLRAVRKAKSMQVDGITFQWSGPQNSALDKPRISGGRDVGNIRVYRKSGDSQSAELPHDVVFAFVAEAFYPGMNIVGAGGDDGKGDGGSVSKKSKSSQAGEEESDGDGEGADGKKS